QRTGGPVRRFTGDPRHEFWCRSPARVRRSAPGCPAGRKTTVGARRHVGRVVAHHRTRGGGMACRSCPSRRVPCRNFRPEELGGPQDMNGPLDTRPSAESHFVELTPKGLRTVRRWAIAITIGSFLFGFDTGIISGALLFIREDFDLSAFQQGLAVSVLLLGAVIGALGSGRISDRHGRRPLLAGLGAAFFIGVVAVTFAPAYWLLLLGRFVMGLAVGGVSATVPTYLGEMAPAQIRGRVLGLNQLLITVGLLTSYLVNWALADAELWRVMFGVA